MNRVLSLLSVFSLIAVASHAADKGKGKEGGKAPEGRKELINNDRVRVVEITMKPGDKAPTHTHPAHVVYALSDSKTKFTLPDGKTVMETNKKGEVEFRAAVTHSAENVGKETNRLLMVEIKDGGKGAPAPKGDDPLKASPKTFKKLFENDRVRVLEATAKPGVRDPLHVHPAYVTYVINGGKVKFIGPDKKSEEVELKEGTASFREAAAHANENVGKTEIQVLVFELKDAPKKK